MFLTFLVLSAAGACQQLRAGQPGLGDRPVLGPFAVHLAYTDGDTIFGRSAATVEELAEAPTTTLLEPAEPVEGVSITMFRNRRWVAWLDDDGNVRVGVVPGQASSAVHINPGANSSADTRPGITASSDHLYVVTSSGKSIHVFWSADGLTWESDVFNMPFPVGGCDVVHAFNGLWIAITSRDHPVSDAAIIAMVPLDVLDQPVTATTTYFPVTALVPAIDGSRRVRIASGDGRFAVSCVSRTHALQVTGVSDNRCAYLTVSEVTDGEHMAWERGSVDQSFGDLLCPMALLLAPSPSHPGLGRVATRGGGQQQSLVAARGQTVLYSGQQHPFEAFSPTLIKDVAITGGREAHPFRDILLRSEVAPN